jgi:outer membrane receptor for ferrienterochelin and colicin
VLQYLFDDKSKEDLEEEEGLRVQQVPQDSDYQFKYKYDLDENNSLTLSANGATDLAEAEFLDISTDVLEDPDMAGDARIKNNFKNAFISWRSQGDAGSQLRIQLGQYQNNNDTFWGDKKYFFNIQNTDSYVTAQYEFPLAENHNLTLGAEAHNTEYDYEARFINYVCTETDPDCLFRRGELVNTTGLIKVKEQTLYFNDHWSISDDLALDLGTQATTISLMKPFTIHALPSAGILWRIGP